MSENNEENLEEEKDEVEEEKKEEAPKLSPDARDHDKGVKEGAQRIFNKMHSIEREDVEEDDIVEPVLMKDNEGSISFVTTGQPKVATVYPANPTLRYSIEVQDSEGNPISIIPNVIANYRMRINMIKGDYKLVVKSEGDLPFSVKIE